MTYSVSITLSESEKESVKNHIIPEAIEQFCFDFKSNSNNYGFILIRNNPLEERLGNTWDFHNKSSISEEVLWTYSSLFWEVYSLKEHQNGLKIQNIFPKKEHIWMQIWSNSGTDLFWHTEFANVKNPCKYILLYCIKWDPNVSTAISKPNINLLQSEHLKLLQDNKFIISPDESMDSSLTYKMHKPILNLSSNGEINTIIFDPIYTLCENNKYKEALNALQENIIKNSKEISLNEGDLLIFNNHITVHSRSYLLWRFDGTDRWLQRICTY